MAFDARVSVEALAGGHAEGQGGIGEVVSDNDFFDFVLEVSASPTACQPQVDNNLIPLTEAL